MKPSGKLLRVEPNHGRKHKTETRIYAREIYETFCVQPGCKFNRQHAQQGVCYSTTPFVEGADWKYIDHAENHALEYLNEHRRLYRKEGPKKYIKACESLIMCYEMNSAFTLDELIRMRRKLALLKVQTTRKVGKRRKNRIKMMNRDVDAPRTRLADAEKASHAYMTARDMLANDCDVAEYERDKARAKLKRLRDVAQGRILVLGHKEGIDD